jgi:hypothetical protein
MLENVVLLDKTETKLTELKSDLSPEDRFEVSCVVCSTISGDPLLDCLWFPLVCNPIPDLITSSPSPSNSLHPPLYLQSLTSLSSFSLLSMFFLFAGDPNCGVNPTQFMESLYNTDGISCEPFECLGWNDFMYFKTLNKQIHNVASTRRQGQDIFLQKVPKFTIGSKNLDINSLIELIRRSHNILVKHSGETHPPTFYCPIKDAALLQSNTEVSFCAPLTDNQEEFYFSVSKSWLRGFLFP